MSSTSLSHREKAVISLVLAIAFIATGVVLTLIHVDSGSGGDPTRSAFRLREFQGSGRCLTRVSCEHVDRDDIEAGHTCSLSMLTCSTIQNSRQKWKMDDTYGLVSEDGKLGLVPDTEGGVRLTPVEHLGDTNHVREMSIEGGALAYWYGLIPEAEPPYYRVDSEDAAHPRGAYLVHTDVSSMRWAPQVHRDPAPTQSILWRDYRQS